MTEFTEFLVNVGYIVAFLVVLFLVYAVLARLEDKP